MQLVKLGHELLPSFLAVWVRDGRSYGTDIRTLLRIKEANALGALVGGDDIYLVALRDGFIGTFGLAQPAHDASIGYDKGHSIVPFLHEYGLDLSQSISREVPMSSLHARGYRQTDGERESVSGPLARFMLPPTRRIHKSLILSLSFLKPCALDYW